MIGTKLAERISFIIFIVILIGNISAVLTIFFVGLTHLGVGVLPKAVMALPLCWLLSIISLSNAFKYVNEDNQKMFDWLVLMPFYYLLMLMSLSLFSVYTLYVYLLCNQRRTVMWSSKFYFIYKLLAILPIINFVILYKVTIDKEDFGKILKLYLSFSLARFIYQNKKTNIDVFS